MLFAVNAVLISCGTYQHATIEDGIYANENDTKRKKKVVVVNERAYSDYNADYFAEELDLVDEINSEDIFLEEDEYNTIDSVNVSTEAEKRSLTHQINLGVTKKTTTSLLILTLDKTHIGWETYGGSTLIDLIIGLSTEDDLTIGDGEIITFMEMGGITIMDGHTLILLDGTITFMVGTSTIDIGALT